MILIPEELTENEVFLGRKRLSLQPGVLLVSQNRILLSIRNILFYPECHVPENFGNGVGYGR
jgi:hypothetical protein